MNIPRMLLRVAFMVPLALVLGSAFLQGVANAQTPIILQLFPTSAKSGSPGFTLTVIGSGFVPGSIVSWGLSAKTTSFFNSTDLEAAISSGDLANPGTVQVTVVNPGAVLSNAVTFTVTTGNLVPILQGLSPSRKRAGDSNFSLTVLGQNFTAQSTVRWNGENRPTTLIDSTTLIAQISASDIRMPGNAMITVIDDAPGGGISNALTFTIAEFSNLYFPQVAVDGGYSTIFTIMNTGTQSDTGVVTLTNQAGNPLVVMATLSSGLTYSDSIFQIVVPAGGVRMLTFNTAGTGTSTPQVGWARLDSTNDLLTGVSTFQTKQGAVLTSIAGVLPVQPQNSVTIPLDNDSSAGRRVGFAVANPSDNPLSFNIRVFDPDGNQVGAPIPLSLAGKKQMARFLDEFASPFATMKGSMILSGSSMSDEFVAIALVLNPGPTGQGLMSVVPVIPFAR